MKTLWIASIVMVGIFLIVVNIHSINKAKKTFYDLKEKQNISNSSRPFPNFIFGHSTGHSGTGSFHIAMVGPGCPWDISVNAFEDSLRSGTEQEKNWPYDPNCSKVLSTLIPHIDEKVQRFRSRGEMSSNSTAVYIDGGHFHNYGRHMECLAKAYGDESAFIHIRRNRYDIARSFSQEIKRNETPCLRDRPKLFHPGAAVCPRSTEDAGPVDLPVQGDGIWDNFTNFQKFLWYADEMEHRWHSIQEIEFENVEIPDRQGEGRPTFLEYTWNTGEELRSELSKLRNRLGCSELEETPHAHVHVWKKNRDRKCNEEIRQDLEYRKLMKYDSEVLETLISSRFPQHVDSEECIESREQLEQAIEVFHTEYGLKLDMGTWVLPEHTS